MSTVDSSYLFVRQVEIMVRQARRGALIAIVAVALLYTLLAPYVGYVATGAWAALVGCSVLLRGAVLGFINKRRRIEMDPILWERALTATTAFMGFALGSSALIFFPRLDFELKALLTVILCSWAAGGCAILAPHPRSYFWYIGFYLPTIAIGWLINEPRYIVVVPLIALLACALVLLSKEIGRLVMSTASLEQDKDHLIADKDTLLLKQETLIEELQHARDLAENANRSKTRFLAVASHDLRQPVQALSLLAGVLDTAVVDSHAKNVTRQIIHAVDTLEELFSAILDLSKLEAGTVTPQIRSFELNDLFHDLEAQYRGAIETKGLRFHVSQLDLDIISDRILMERMLGNLLQNALKFTSRGTISLNVAMEHGACVISVGDTGSGIPLEEQKNIFEEFYQLGYPSGYSDTGLGLGLAIVKLLAKVLKVDVRVDSLPGHGSTFSVRLPSDAFAAAQNRRRSWPTKSQAKLLNRIVVLIDDDSNIREALKLALAGWGAHPIAARDAHSALAQLNDIERAPDMLLVDYQLGEGVFGPAAIEVIRARYPGVPAAIMTGDSTETISGLSDWPVLRKPVSHEALGRYLDSILT